jgi:hypothetical protein
VSALLGVGGWVGGLGATRLALLPSRGLCSLASDPAGGSAACFGVNCGLQFFFLVVVSSLCCLLCYTVIMFIHPSSKKASTMYPSSSLSVLRSAFRSGSLSSFLFRSSNRSLSGVVVECSFSSAPRAGRFASRWSARLGVPVFVRRGAGFWFVSVPVASPGAFPSWFGFFVPVRGGLRGFCSVLGGVA